MSAYPTEHMSYSWYCEDCGEGGRDYDNEYSAHSEMEEHNEEKH